MIITEMNPSPVSVTLAHDKGRTLETVTMLLSKHKDIDYYAYERGESWYIGLGSRASLFIDSRGEKVTVATEKKQFSRVITEPFAEYARTFVAENSNGGKIFGQVGFNYAAHIQGKQYKPGIWPLLSLMVPRIQLAFFRDQVTVCGYDAHEMKGICDLIKWGVGSVPVHFLPIAMEDNPDKYTGQVGEALSDIARGQYSKVITSRMVSIKNKVDMPATLLRGRRSNNPARSFSLNHAGFQATGFSPELVASIEDRNVVTETMAGTRSRTGTEEQIESLRQELVRDPKEIVEHMISVKGAIEELNSLCTPETVRVEDLMSVRPRGSVQHLGSRVAGTLSADKDVWDAFDVLFPSITATGIPKQAALEAIQRIEHRPRELYSGAVLMLDDSESMEAALVLRSVFQDPNRQWIQAGAGVIAQSNPEHELIETREQLGSVAPFVVADINK